jgi:hypothetical protein
MNHSPYSPYLVPNGFHLLGNDTEGRNRGPIVTLSWSLPGRTKENHEIRTWQDRGLAQDFKFKRPECEALQLQLYCCTHLHSKVLTDGWNTAVTPVGLRQDTQYLWDLGFQTNIHLPALKLKGDFRFSQRRWRFSSSRMLRRVIWWNVKAISEERSASIFSETQFQNTKVKRGTSWTDWRRRWKYQLPL